MGSTTMTLKLLLLGEDRSASKSVTGLASVAEKVPGKVAAGLGKVGSLIGGEVGELISKVSEGIEQISEHAKGIAPKVAAGGAAIAGLGAAAQMVGSADKAAAEQLKTAIENAGGSYADYREEIEKTVKSQENVGNSAVQTQRALQILTQATNDPKKALEQLNMVSDLAAAKHMSLSDAATQVAKVYGGSTKVLKQFGITVDSTKAAATALTSAERQRKAAVDNLAHAQRTLTDIEAVDGQRKKLTLGQEIQLRNAHEAVTKAQEKLKASNENLTEAQKRNAEAAHGTDEALEKLAGKVKGQASASVDSFAGKLTVLRTKLTDDAAQLGQKYGPAVTAVGVGLGALGSILQVVTTARAAAATAGAADAAATEAETVATEGQSIAAKAAAAAQWLLNAALDANPIMIVVIAVVALIAIFVLAYHKVAWFRAGVDAAFSGVKAAVLGTINWVRGNWPMLLAILTGPIGMAVLVIVRHWSSIKSGFADVKNFIARGIGDIVGFFTGMPGRIARAASGMFHGVTDAFRAAINEIIGGWNRLHFSINIPKKHIPGTNMDIGGGSIGFGVPAIPFLSQGGIATRATLAMIGEGREPEAVLPLSRLRSLLGSAGPAAAPAPVIVEIKGGIFLGTKREIGELMAGALREYRLAGGVM